MPAQNIAYLVLALGLVVWVIYRQVTWQLVTPSRMWRMPIILAIIGIVEVSQVKGVTSVSGIDLAVLGGEIVFALGVGAGMGALARFRARPQEERDLVSRRSAPGSVVANPNITVIESRTGGWGAALWIVLIAVRVAIEIFARQLDDSGLVTSIGMVLIVIAANRVARVLVIQSRVSRLDPATLAAA